jgi:hypothetical protein
MGNRVFCFCSDEDKKKTQNLIKEKDSNTSSWSSSPIKLENSNSTDQFEEKKRNSKNNRVSRDFLRNERFKYLMDPAAKVQVKTQMYMDLAL